MCCSRPALAASGSMRASTAPLWRLRTKPRLMHDLPSFTRNDAIFRHGGEATFVINNYQTLSRLRRMT